MTITIEYDNRYGYSMKFYKRIKSIYVAPDGYLSVGGEEVGVLDRKDFEEFKQAVESDLNINFVDSGEGGQAPLTMTVNYIR